MRRRRPAMYADNYLYIDCASGIVTAGGEPVHLTPTEFRLLECLVRHAGQVVPQEVLLATAWGPEYTGATHHVRLYISYLRRKIEKNPDNPEYILTIWGQGYSFHPPRS
jgi:two-component system KDP operon response regulator KdpE